jgi:hypothetical protein
MAKLRARGRTEVLRGSRETPGEGEGVSQRTEYRLMSDGVILVNHSWNRRNDSTQRMQTESTGWKVCGRSSRADALAVTLEARGFSVARAGERRGGS